MIFQDESSNNSYLYVQIDKLILLQKKKLENWIFYFKTRWFAFLFFVLLYIFRVCYYGGYYLVTLVFLLQFISQILQFMIPIGGIQDGLELIDDYLLPNQFISKKDAQKISLKKSYEFQMWKKLIIMAVLANTCTMFQFLDIYYFQPLLFIYVVWYFLNLSKKFNILKESNLQKY